MAADDGVPGDGDAAAGGSAVGDLVPAEESTPPVEGASADSDASAAAADVALASVSVPAALAMPAAESDRDALIDDEDRHDAKKPRLMLTIYSNLAATFVAMEKYQDGLYVCEDAFQFARVLGLDAARIDVKLYFRRGTCAMHLHLYEQAIHSFQEAATLQPKDAAIAKKLQEAKRALEQQRKREMRAYSRMFGVS
eukprot:gene298-189_t